MGKHLVQFSSGTEDRPCPVCLKAGDESIGQNDSYERHPLWGEGKDCGNREYKGISRESEWMPSFLRTKPIIIRFKRALSRLMCKKMYCDKIESYDYDGQLLHPWQRSSPYLWNSAIPRNLFRFHCAENRRRRRGGISCDLNSPRCACLHTLRLCIVYAPGLVWLSYLLNARIYRGSCTFRRIWKLCRLILYYKKVLKSVMKL